MCRSSHFDECGFLINQKAVLISSFRRAVWSIETAAWSRVPFFRRSHTEYPEKNSTQAPRKNRIVVMLNGETRSHSLVKVRNANTTDNPSVISRSNRFARSRHSIFLRK